MAEKFLFTRDASEEKTGVEKFSLREGKEGKGNFILQLSSLKRPRNDLGRGTNEALAQCN